MGTMSSSRAALPTFEELARLPDDELDVAVGAALVARDAYDQLDAAALVREVQSLGEPLALADLAEAPPSEQAAIVSARFRELGFRGNSGDYYDPKNSLLSDVLERRLGIPITLSLVWCEIANCAGVAARGVAFPGHFLVRVDGAKPDDAPAIVDPFDGGRLLVPSDAAALLRRAMGDGAMLHPSLFAPASSRATLVRLLTNLETTWTRRGEHARALVAVDRILSLVPDSTRALRDRAQVAIRLGATEMARADLERVVTLEPEAPDAPMLRAQLARLSLGGRSVLH